MNLEWLSDKVREHVCRETKLNVPAPPCPGCAFWNPVIYLGQFKACHKPTGPVFDFSCFAPKPPVS